MKPSFGFYIAFCFCSLELFSKHITAQADTAAWFARHEINIGGFVDVLYAYDFNMPEGNVRQPFLHNYNYSDPQGVIVRWPSGQSFETAGYSLNLDYFPTANLSCRLECRNFASDRHIYVDGKGYKRTNTAVLASIAIQITSTVCR